MVNIYDQLLRVGLDGKTLVPDLATSWKVSKDGLTYTFNLRPNVVFQDGTKLTASDVQFSLERATKPSQLWSWTLSAIKTVAAPNPSTVVVTLKHPWAPFLSDVSLFDTGIYPAAYFKKVGAAGVSSHPIGTGPYMLDSWVKGQHIRLKKNAQYWDAAKYPMEYVEYDLLPNDNTRLLQVEAGELDVDNVLPFNQVQAVKSNPAVQVQIDKSTETRYFTFNTRAAPFNNANVRQAITHAIDRSAMAKAVTYGYGTPANSFIPAGAIGYDAKIPVPTHDLALAKKLLAQSPVPNGFSMTMEVSSGDSISNEQAQIFQAEMLPLGINVTLQPQDPTTLFRNQQQDCSSAKAGTLCPNFHFTDNLWTNDIPDPDELVSFSVDSTLGSHSFYTWYDNPKLTALSQRAEQTSDSATRTNLYYQIQQIWSQESHLIALYYVPFVNAVSSKVHGFSESPLGYFNLQGVTKS